MFVHNLRPLRSLTALTLGTLLFACGGNADPDEGHNPNPPDEDPTPPVLDGDVVFDVQVLTDRLENPWAVVMLPDSRVLITERPGRMRIFNLDTTELSAPLTGVPSVASVGQGGLLDVILHPQFETNQLIYFSYAAGSNNRYSTEVARAQLTENGLEDIQNIFVAQPKTSANQHFGSRLVFDNDGYLFIGLGDRGDMDEAQRLESHNGTVVRLHDDGRVPSDNPFVDTPNALPEIYSYGHRNIQGAAINPWSGEIWTHEHGPQGGDEVNILSAGANYGWPVITYGVNYGIGTPIGEGIEKEGMEQPLHQWTPSIAPSGLAFYDYTGIPDWHGDLLVGALAHQFLGKYDIDGRQLSNEERLLDNHGRIRAINVDSNGDIYVINDQRNGQLIRIRPSLE